MLVLGVGAYTGLQCLYLITILVLGHGVYTLLHCLFLVVVLILDHSTYTWVQCLYLATVLAPTMVPAQAYLIVLQFQRSHFIVVLGTTQQGLHNHIACVGLPRSSHCSLVETVSDSRPPRLLVCFKF